MIELRKIKHQSGFVYKECEDSKDLWVGSVDNYAEYLYMRLQIKRAQEYGYYMMFGDQKVKFDKNGTPEYEPDGFFGKTEVELLLDLL